MTAIHPFWTAIHPHGPLFTPMDRYAPHWTAIHPKHMGVNSGPTATKRNLLISSNHGNQIMRTATHTEKPKPHNMKTQRFILHDLVLGLKWSPQPQASILFFAIGPPQELGTRFALVPFPSVLFLLSLYPTTHSCDVLMLFLCCFRVALVRFL